MFGHRDHDYDFDDDFFNKKWLKHEDEELEFRGGGMGANTILAIVGGVGVIVIIIIGCCCSKKRRGGQILSPPPPPPAPNQPALVPGAAPYPQQQYSPYPTQAQPMPVAVGYPVGSISPYPAVSTYPPAMSPYPQGAPYPSGAPYPHPQGPSAPDAHVFSTTPLLSTHAYTSFPQAPGWGVQALPPSYDQVMGHAQEQHQKQPPYNPHAPH